MSLDLCIVRQHGKKAYHVPNMHSNMKFAKFSVAPSFVGPCMCVCDGNKISIFLLRDFFLCETEPESEQFELTNYRYLSCCCLFVLFRLKLNSLLTFWFI